MSSAAPNPWPKLPTPEWTDTLETLHLWTQIVGKIRMVQSPWLNHSWSVPFYVSSTGLTTSLVPYQHEGFEFTFDFIGHVLRLTTTTGTTQDIRLEPKSVATFYGEVMEAMRSAKMPVEIHPIPNEIPDATPFPEDEQHASYERAHAHVLWRTLLQSHRVFSRFRAGFLGKASPVHFFWGSFDLAVTRFSGRVAPPHGGGVPNFPDDVAQEAYSHEVTSCGLWLGNRASPTPLFYGYAYPTPEGYSQAKVQPDSAAWQAQLGEFVLPYEAVQAAAEPDATLMTFLKSTHGAAADLLEWDRAHLECTAPRGPDWWHTRPHV
ncbi:MAG: DUF5996 family protein [Myxococcota bacterium]